MASDIYNTGQSNVKNAFSSGQNAINSFDPNAWQQNTQNGYNSLWNNQSKGNQDLVNAFKTQISSQPSATQYYQQGMDAFNVQPLQNTANQLNNAVLTAPNSNLNAARGFNYDQNQIDQKTSQDLQRLAPAAQAAQNNATTAQNNALSYANNGIQQNQMNLVPLQQQATSQAALYAAQATGYGQQQQQQLAALQAKMQAGQQLSSDEMSAYGQLTSAEANYQAALNSANAQIKSATIANQNQILPQGATYLNPVTGMAYNPFATPAKP